MAGAQIRITLHDEPVQAAIAELLRRGANLRPAMAEIGSYLELATDRRFETETGPDGQPWPPSIRAQIQGGQTLTDSARLRQSVTSEVGDRSLAHGTNVVYAAAHQFGATITARAGGKLRFRLADGGWRQADSVKLPPRPFLGINTDDERAIGEILTDHLAETPGVEQ